MQKSNKIKTNRISIKRSRQTLQQSFYFFITRKFVEVLFPSCSSLTQHEMAGRLLALLILSCWTLHTAKGKPGFTSVWTFYRLNPTSLEIVIVYFCFPGRYGVAIKCLAGVSGDKYQECYKDEDYKTCFTKLVDGKQKSIHELVVHQTWTVSQSVLLRPCETL